MAKAKPLKITPHNSTGKAGALTRVRRAETAAKRLMGKRLLYSYGGGRVDGRIIDPPSEGMRWTDCSGFATYLLDVAGVKLKNEAGSTWSLAEEGEKGVGAYFTLFIKNNPGDEHVIVRGRKKPKPWHFGRPRYRYWQCGGSDNPKADNGPSYFIPGLQMGLTWKSRVDQFYAHRNFDSDPDLNDRHDRIEGRLTGLSLRLDGIRHDLNAVLDPNRKDASMLAAYRKAVVAVVGLVVIVLHNHGVEVAEDLSTGLISALTAIGVYFFPNG
jgi:hypothetical protein